jgi:hypothetical protein
MQLLSTGTIIDGLTNTIIDELEKVTLGGASSFLKMLASMKIYVMQEDDGGRCTLHVDYGHADPTDFTISSQLTITFTIPKGSEIAKLVGLLLEATKKLYGMLPSSLTDTIETGMAEVEYILGIAKKFCTGF